MKKGKSVIFKGPGEKMEMLSGHLGKLGPGEILVKNEFTSLCGSDLHTYCGLRDEPTPVVLGHEIVGQVVEIGCAHSGIDYRGEKISVGDHITWSIFSSDPSSWYATQGIPQKGNGLFKYGHQKAIGNDIFNGGLSEYCVLQPFTGILKLPPDLPLPIAATINCSLSTAAGALRLAGDIQHKNVLIFGMGVLGLACAAMCRDAGANWIGAADLSEKRLDMARKFGVTDVFHLTGQNDDLSAIKTELERNGADISFDMSGSPEAMESSVEQLAIGGTAIWVGAVYKARKVQLDQEQVVRRLLTIRGLHNYNFGDFTYALDFIHKNWRQYPFEKIIEKEFSLHDAQKAFEYALRHKPLRVGIRISST